MVEALPMVLWFMTNVPANYAYDDRDHYERQQAEQDNVEPFRHASDCAGWEDCQCFHVTIRKEHYAALIAVAEAALHHEMVRSRSSLFEEYEASHKVLQYALAALYKPL